MSSSLRQATEEEQALVHQALPPGSSCPLARLPLGSWVQARFDHLEAPAGLYQFVGQTTQGDPLLLTPDGLLRVAPKETLHTVFLLEGITFQGVSYEEVPTDGKQVKVVPLEVIPFVLLEPD